MGLKGRLFGRGHLGVFSKLVQIEDCHKRLFGWNFNLSIIRGTYEYIYLLLHIQIRKSLM